jgi:uncharacterized membrane protein YciS (DUF1049 family)
MRWLMQVVKLLLFLVVFVWAMLMLRANPDTTSLVLPPLELPPRSLGFWVLLSFVVGGAAGTLVTSLLFLRYKGRELRMRRDLKRSSTELEQERSARLEAQQLSVAPDGKARS